MAGDFKYLLYVLPDLLVVASHNPTVVLVACVHVGVLEVPMRSVVLSRVLWD